MEIALSILAKAFWCGFAALGFGMLFNAPVRALHFIWIGGFLAGIIKFGLMLTALDGGIVFSSFAASVGVGIASIPVAHRSHVPPVIFSIPAVIPLVPGAFAYKTMMGFMKLTSAEAESYAQTLGDTFHNGSLTLFIIIAISLGVAIPMHVLRKASVKKIRFGGRG